VTAHATNIGFYLSESDNNMILSVTAKDNADAGIIVIGNNNLVKDSYARRQQFEGIAFSGDNS
jgi:parallel beta-helix repeat protein